MSTTKVTLITGFLGSGKTTLIQKLIKMPELSKKIAIFQNEFSENMGIESPLMTDDNGVPIDDFYEFPNGCICCTVKDDLLKQIEFLVEKRKDIEHILIESNGLADPAEIIKIFWLDDYQETTVKYNFTMCMIDARNFVSTLSNESTHLSAENQVIFADKILINKSDLVSEQEIEEIKREIGNLNSET
jgi:G3E family GTPase